LEYHKKKIKEKIIFSNAEIMELEKKEKKRKNK